MEPLLSTETRDAAGADSSPSPCSEFLVWSHEAGYSTCTSDIQLALWEAWQAGLHAKRGVWLACYKLKQIADGDIAENQIRQHAQGVVEVVAPLSEFYIPNITMSCTAPKEARP